MTKKELELKFIRDLKSGKQMIPVGGAFGDHEDCGGILEEEIYPETGGSFSKWYGCKQLFKGVPISTVIEGIGIGKAFISSIPLNIIMKSLVLKTYFLYLFVFNRKKFYRFAVVYFNVAVFHLIHKLNFEKNSFNKLTKELRRCVDLEIQRIDEKMGYKKAEHDRILSGNQAFRVGNDLTNIIANISEFFYVFIESDSYYRFVLQDMFEIFDKEKAGKNIIKEWNRVMKIVVSRDTNIPYKFDFVRKTFIVLMVLSPIFRSFIKNIILNINKEEVKLDSDDWYFCLNRVHYKFRGIDIYERNKEKKRIDEESGNFSVKMVNLQYPDGVEKKAFKIEPFNYIYLEKEGDKEKNK